MAWRHFIQTVAIVIIMETIAFAGTTSENPNNKGISAFLPTNEVRQRLQNIVTGILGAWDKADVICPWRRSWK